MCVIACADWGNDCDLNESGQTERVDTAVYSNNYLDVAEEVAAGASITLTGTAGTWSGAAATALIPSAVARGAPTGAIYGPLFGPLGGPV